MKLFKVHESLKSGYIAVVSTNPAKESTIELYQFDSQVGEFLSIVSYCAYLFQESGSSASSSKRFQLDRSMVIVIMLAVIIALLVFIVLNNTGLSASFKKAAGFAARKLASFAEVGHDSEPGQFVIVNTS